MQTEVFRSKGYYVCNLPSDGEEQKLCMCVNVCESGEGKAYVNVHQCVLGGGGVRGVCECECVRMCVWVCG